MERRRFLMLVGGAPLALPGLVRAQSATKVWRIGYLGFGAAPNWTSEIDALRSGLRELGYVEGKNLKIEFRWAERADQTFELASQLVQSNVDVIFAPASTQVEPARRATSTIPIVFAQHADPVGLGDITSLSRPGGNITGMSMLLTELSVKELEILQEILPKAKTIGVLWNPSTPSHPTALKGIESAGTKLGLQLILTPAQSVPEIEAAFSAMSQQQASGVLVLSSPLFSSQAATLAELQMKHRLPAIFANKANVEAGGFASYGADLADLYRRAAIYIGKILHGTAPAELPVEQASKYFMVLNLRTAKALDIDIPATVIARADEVVE
jgi:putative ABC transport system substrate-binding protein